jgi:hypothetical protein
MSYEEEDTCHMRRRIHVMTYIHIPNGYIAVSGSRGYMSYEEEDTCHMRRRIHVMTYMHIRNGYIAVSGSRGYMSYEEEDTCHMRRRIHVMTYMHIPNGYIAVSRLIFISARTNKRHHHSPCTVLFTSFCLSEVLDCERLQGASRV